MAIFPDAWLDELLSKSDIASVVGEYCTLKPKGQRLWGLCPFHGEKTPSFSVSAQKQLYYCFGCHAGGNVIHFIMEINRMTFVEAVEFLARRAGMELPVNTNDEKLQRDRAQRERCYAALKLAARFYFERLKDKELSKEARAYLAKRGLRAETVKQFGLGVSPPEWQSLTDELLKQGFKKEELVLAGLAQKGKREDNVYDTFRNRIMFPIIGTNNRVLGFGARAMGDEQPKYLNSTDTPVFNKRNHLYGLNRLTSMRLKDILVVEGYMDVIGLANAGVVNAVATLGTALTPAQAKLLKRYVQDVYLCYDGDAAGQNATLRGMDILKDEGLNVRVMRIPEKLDPDEYVLKYGKDAFESLKDQALNIPSFRLEHMASSHDLSQEDERETFAKQACAYIATLEPIERERYYKLVARKTGLSLEALMQQGKREEREKKNTVGSFRHTREKIVRPEKSPREKLEAKLLGRMAASYEFTMRVIEALGLEVFQTPSYQAICGAMLSGYAESDTLNVSALFNELEQDQAKELAEILSQADTAVPTLEEADDYIKTIRLSEIEQEKLELSAQAEREEISMEQRRDILERIRQLNEELSLLKS